jgi:cyclase
MLRSRIIPSLLLHNKGLVKTRKFSDPRYIGDPINAVKIFNEKKVDELVFFDIDASANKNEPDYNLLTHIANESRMPICFGGGVASAKIASHVISIGFEKVSLSSAALLRPYLIKEVSETIGSQSVVVTIDVKKNKLLGGYSIFILNGSIKVDIDLLEFCEHAFELGVGELIINSIDRDGTMEGYDFQLVKLIRNHITCPLSILGGASNLDNMQQLINQFGVIGLAAGSIFVFQGKYQAVLINYSRPAKLF